MRPVRLRHAGRYQIAVRRWMDVSAASRGKIQSLFDQSGQCPLDAGDAAPDLEEVLAPLHFRRARRMVGTDHIDFSTQD